MADVMLQTPERVLRRMRELEDMELPSLPSFQHNIDYDSESGNESSDQENDHSEVVQSEIDPTTPHPIRMQAPSTAGKTFTVTTLPTPSDTSSASSASPFPPLDNSNGPTSSTSNTVALTSTPHSQRSRRFNSTITNDRRESAVTLKSSTSSRRDIWSTPGQMSMSFDGEEIPVIHEELGAELSIPLNDASEVSYDHSQPSATPVTRRLSQGHVLLQRPGRRGLSSGLQALQQVQEELDAYPATALHITPHRIPSLTKSEISATDTSGGASTPEGPMRVLAVDTSLSQAQISVFYDVEQNSEEHLEQPTNTYDAGAETDEYSLPSLPQQEISRSVNLPTPGLARARAISDDTYNASPARSTPLGDITSAQNLPFTPSPANYSKASNFSTPRPILDDAERRKNHVLAVLSSTGLPSRTMRSVRGTPHPLRRVSVAPHSESIAEEGSPMPAMQYSYSVDQSGNESFVSIASSADLTSDRRASHLPNHLARGNTSFPNILLPTGGVAPSPGGSLRDGLSDKRVDGAKLHKHLNAMNQQLLQENGELAREAGIWRDEVERLRSALQNAGIEIENMPTVGQVSFTDLPQRRTRRPPSLTNSTSSPRKDDSWETKLDRQFEKTDLLVSQLSQLGRRDATSSPSGRSAQDILEGMSPEEHAAVMQEMAEKLEALEEGLEAKDRQIQDLEAELQNKSTGGISHQIEELSRQVDEASKAREELQSEFALKTEQHAKQFGEICSAFQEQVKNLTRDLESSKAEVERVKEEKTRMESIASSGGLDEKEVEWRKQMSELESQLGSLRMDLSAKQSELDSKARDLEQLARAKGEAEGRAQEAENRIGDFEIRLRTSRSTEKDLEDELSNFKTDLENSETARRALDDDLHRTLEQVTDLQQSGVEQEAELEKQFEEIQDLTSRIQELEEALENTGGSDEANELRKQLEEVNAALEERDEDLEELRAKLDRTVALDQSQLQEQPLIADLEERLDEAHREIGRLKHDLAGSPHRKTAIDIKDARIKALEREKAVLVGRLGGVKSPLTSTESPFSKATPFVHRAITSLKTPKTPGPLKDLSWLNTTIGDPNEPVLAAQIQYLQTELQNANSQLDNNFDRLESAGLGAVALAEKLAAAQDRIAQLESELAALRTGSETSMNVQRESAALTQALEDVHQQMDQLKSDMGTERERIQMDNGRLNDLVSELRLKSQKEVEVFRNELERVADDAEDEMDRLGEKIKNAIEERDALRTDLQSLTVKNRKIERELVDRQNALDELSARHARHQRNLATQSDEIDKKEMLQLRNTLREVQSQTNQVRDDLAERTRSLRNAEDNVRSLERERDAVTNELRIFERDLEVQRRECRKFGTELQNLKRQQESKASGHASALLRLENELRSVKQSLKDADRCVRDTRERYDALSHWKSNHTCETGKHQALEDQKARFKAQSRELAGQVRYLKAKYTREATFRNALALQKRYLLLLVGSMSLHEQASLKIIATMGFPMPAPSRPRRSLKTVGLAVVAMIRAKKQADQWRTELDARAMMSHERRLRS